MTELIDATSADYEERDAFRHGLLGLLSMASRLDRLLHRHAPRDGAHVGPIVSLDDPVLECVLGLVAVRDRLVQHAAASCEEASCAPAVATSGDAASAAAAADGSLLR